MVDPVVAQAMEDLKSQTAASVFGIAYYAMIVAMPRDGAIVFGDLIGKLDVLVWQKLTNSWPQTTRQT